MTIGFPNLPEAYYDLYLKQERFPVRYWIDENIPEVLIAPTHDVLSDWNAKMGFTAFTIEGTYAHNTGLISSQDQLDTTDGKNVIYWGINLPPDLIFEEIHNGLTNFSEIRYGPYQSFITVTRESNVFINSGTPAFSHLYPDVDLEATVEHYRRFGIEIPSNFKEDYDAFRNLRSRIKDFLENGDIKDVRRLVLSEVESALNSNDESIVAEANNLFEIYSSVPDETLELFRPRFVRRVDRLFSRSNFNQIKQKVHAIILFENILKHEIGHVLGLNDLTENDINPSDFKKQLPLLWLSVRSVYDDELKSYLNEPVKVDQFTMDTLSCIYDLDALRSSEQ